MTEAGRQGEQSTEAEAGKADEAIVKAEGTIKPVAEQQVAVALRPGGGALRPVRALLRAGNICTYVYTS